jgi:hypothetical protein
VQRGTLSDGVIARGVRSEATSADGLDVERAKLAQSPGRDDASAAIAS